jgi:HlyD family secretion protein
MDRKKWLLAGAALVIVLVMVFTLSGGQQVEGVKAKPGSIRTWIEDTGYVQNGDDIVMQASLSAKVVQVKVEAGQKVLAGQELLVMENPDLQYQLDSLAAQIEQLQGSLTAAQIKLDESCSTLLKEEKDWSRTEQLHQAGAIAEADYEAARQKKLSQEKMVQQDTASLQSLQVQLGQQKTAYQDLNNRNQQLLVKSPINGIILDVPVKKEQAVIPGMTLVQVGDGGKMEVKTELLSDDLADIKVGQNVEITAPLLGEKILLGQVKKIYPRAYEKTSALGVVQRRVPVLVTLPANELLKPGYEVQVKIETRLKKNVLLVPREAIRADDQGRNEVLAIVDGRVKHVLITTGLKNPDVVEILSGLQTGQMIVRDGSTDIKEKTWVKIIN